MKRKIIILTVLIAVVIVNLFLTYLLMWDPYSIYFDRAEFSETHFQTRDNFAMTAAIINFIILWGTLIWAFIDWTKKARFNLFAPIMSILTFWVLMEIKDYYPDGRLEWTENGYRFKVEEWYLDGDKVYKRWKSRDSMQRYENHREIVWELESTNEE